jgi:hypothetical protein
MSQEMNSEDPADAPEQLKRKILSDYPRLGPDDTFTFSCHPGVPCFNHCCGDVNIFLALPVLAIFNCRVLRSTQTGFRGAHRSSA